MKNAFCISKQVISGARFLRLSATAQSLYMHLNADADDDGIVEAFATINKVRANEQDLIQLVQSGFLIVLNKNELIAYITDWVRHNRNIDIRWHKQSEYLDLLADVCPSAKVYVAILRNNKKIKMLTTAKEAILINNTNKKIIPTHENLLSSREILMLKRKEDNNYKKLLSSFQSNNIYTCPVCQGKGTVDNLICPTCEGAGEITYNIKERSI